MVNEILFRMFGFQAYNKLLTDKKEANAKKTEERRRRELEEQAKLIREHQVSQLNISIFISLSSNVIYFEKLNLLRNAVTFSG